MRAIVKKTYSSSCRRLVKGREQPEGRDVPGVLFQVWNAAALLERDILEARERRWLRQADPGC